LCYERTPRVRFDVDAPDPDSAHSFECCARVTIFATLGASGRRRAARISAALPPATGAAFASLQRFRSLLTSLRRTSTRDDSLATDPVVKRPEEESPKSRSSRHSDISSARPRLDTFEIAEMPRPMLQPMLAFAQAMDRNDFPAQADSFLGEASPRLAARALDDTLEPLMPCRAPRINIMNSEESIARPARDYLREATSTGHTRRMTGAPCACTRREAHWGPVKGPRDAPVRGTRRARRAPPYLTAPSRTSGDDLEQELQNGRRKPTGERTEGAGRATLPPVRGVENPDLADLACFSPLVLRFTQPTVPRVF